MLCEVNPKGSLESDWVVYSDSIYLPYEQGTQWWSQEASVSRTEEFPQNAVRHAFATKNAGCNGSGRRITNAADKCQENFAKPWAMVLTLASFALVWTSSLYSNLSCHCSHLGPVEKGVNPAIATECYMIWTCDRPAVVSIASQKPHAYEMFYHCVGILRTRYRF